jgi:hypothetical protein
MTWSRELRDSIVARAKSQVVRALVGALTFTSMSYAGTVAGANTSLFKLPKAGTSSAIAKLVASSTTIETVPRNISVPIAQWPADNPTNTKYKPDVTCKTFSANCTYGDKSSKRVIVLFGDSHAWMWLPAIVPFAMSKHFKVQLLTVAGCPVAEITFVWPFPHLPDTSYRR